MSDLSGEEGSTEILLKDAIGAEDYQKKVNYLKAEMDHLQAEVGT